MTIERLSIEELQSGRAPQYLDTYGLHGFFDKLAFRANLILSGPKGCGKSTAISAWGASRSVPTLTIDCSEDTRRSQLVGTFVLRGNETPFILGPVANAFEIANESGSCLVILEEISCLVPSVQKILNGVADWRQSLEVPEAKKVFRLREGARLWLVGTMNDAGYSGTFALNEDLKSRFRIVPCRYPKRKDEHAIVLSNMSLLGVSVEPQIVEKLLTLAQETRAGGVLGYALSTRDLVQAAEDVGRVGLVTALWLLTGKFDGNDRATVSKRIEAIFGIDPSRQRS